MTSLTMHNVPIEIQNLIAGGLAGALAKSAVAPIERVKLLMQLQSSLAGQGGNALRVRSPPMPRHRAMSSSWLRVM